MKIDSNLKRKILVGLVVVIALAGFSYLNTQRQKELDSFIQMQAAPLQRAEEK